MVLKEWFTYFFSFSFHNFSLNDLIKNICKSKSLINLLLGPLKDHPFILFKKRTFSVTSLYSYTQPLKKKINTNNMLPMIVAFLESM